MKTINHSSLLEAGFHKKDPVLLFGDVYSEIYTIDKRFEVHKHMLSYTESPLYVIADDEGNLIGEELSNWEDLKEIIKNNFNIDIDEKNNQS